MDGSDTLGPVDSVLQHYGVKGMKWGVTRDNPGGGPGQTQVNVKARPGKRVKTSGGRKQGASSDAVTAAVSKQIAKKSTTDALSNKQLQELVTRMNLEKQYNQLSKEQKGKFRRGLDAVKGILGVAKEVDQVLGDVTKILKK